MSKFTFKIRKRKFKKWWSTITPISTKRTITSYPKSLNIKSDHDIWCWKSRFWLWAGKICKGVKPSYKISKPSLGNWIFNDKTYTHKRL